MYVYVRTGGARQTADRTGGRAGSLWGGGSHVCMPEQEGPGRRLTVLGGRQESEPVDVNQPTAECAVTAAVLALCAAAAAALYAATAAALCAAAAVAEPALLPVTA